jgi:small nuclear ribonucleoprotein (snRNP)-like protein
MNNGRQYVGKPRLYDKYSNIQDITSVEVMLFRDIPLWYHIGGEKLQIYINGIKNIIVMNEQEIEDSKKYTNNAILFVQRLFPDP